ncbi:MAG: acyl carrier protein [bacterium]
MNRITGDDIRRHVVEAISDLLVQMGSAPTVPEDSPIEALGLDSLAGVQFVCDIEDRLDIKIPTDINPFVDDSKKRLRRVSEVIAFVEQLVQ